MNTEQICRQVIEVAKAAGAFIRNESLTFNTNKVESKGLNDFVSYVDKGAEKIIVDGVENLIPGAGFITEENTRSTTGNGSQWIIDPLDGTTNFVHGLPCYCVSIALTVNDELVLGVIYEINQDECFYGWKGGGAWMNGNRIYTSSAKHLKDGLICTGFPYTNFSRLKEYMEVFDYCMKHTHGVRRLGSAAVDLAYVACGRFEAFFEYGLNAWDVAAGAFLVAEAGGRVSDFKGGDDYLFGKEIVTSAFNVHDEFISVIQEKFN